MVIETADLDFSATKYTFDVFVCTLYNAQAAW